MVFVIAGDPLSFEIFKFFLDVFGYLVDLVIIKGTSVNLSKQFVHFFIS